MLQIPDTEVDSDEETDEEPQALFEAPPAVERGREVTNIVSHPFMDSLFALIISTFVDVDSIHCCLFGSSLTLCIYLL